ncbi:protein translocase subunit SecD [Rariglobus hedericola]|uniref:Multifunctional fusion protein n=1 Tax=Rariglobus hedericola TaxID=2597822 RepID=A0A556QNH5_9BACT|nr:protein translocase subunit SecD [Rariglobus hedericola]TSJ78200.1 protein translocase subunit SecD [Rariglobus hedericola]
MFKRNFWKLTLSLAVVLWALSSLLPIQDQPFAEFAKSKSEAKSAEFAALIKESSDRVVSKQAPSVFVALKAIAKERKIDLSQYFPQFPLESSLGNVEKRNAILLDHLLAKSKGRLQLGLDLKGGVAFTLEASDTPATANIGDAERKEKLSKAIEIIGDRINGLGVAEPIIRAVGANRIEVQLPGVNTKDNPEIVASVQKPARLDFRLVYPFGTPAMLGETPSGYEVLTLEQDIRGQVSSEEVYVKRLPAMTGEGISGAYPVMDEFGRFKINLRFDDAGSKRFAEVTREIAGYSQQLQQQTGSANARARLAIVLDGKLYSAPGVEKEIAGGSAEISGSFSQREAFELANVLNNPLDLPLQIKEQYEVGPSLAADAVSSGKLAFIIGTALTAAFIIIFYTSGGFLAVIAMILNVVIILGVMASIGATLSMPGIAGIVLTIGMSVDSNILIFERMREELKLGKSLPSALEAGFEKAFSAILDGNLTTLITAAIMIVLGTGPVKGFGVTLAIGIFSTMFAALVISRLFLDWSIHGGYIKRMRMVSILENTNYDFLKYARGAFIVSWLIVLTGVAVVAFKGKDIYGIDFTGGDQVTLAFEKAIPLSEVRKTAAAQGIEDLSLSYTKQIGGDTEVLRLTTTFDQAKPFVQALQAAHPDAGFTLVSEARIGPSVGDEIKSNALWAIFWSLVLILVYVAFRFEMGYGIGAVVSTLHDVVLTIGIFVMLGGQFNASMVAAILLIVGYSINDTIVVFDRIREELTLNPSASLKNVINRSLNLTLSRTLITGGTTFLTAVVLATVAGGEVRDLAITLIIGVITGTFSSLYIASPVFYWWHKGDRRHVEKSHDVKPTYEWDAGSKASQ